MRDYENSFLTLDSADVSSFDALLGHSITYRPARFSAEQVAGIIALACDLPADSGAAVVTLATWRVGARSRQKRSRREHLATAGRPFFSDADLRPHKSQYWLTSRPKARTS